MLAGRNLNIELRLSVWVRKDRQNSAEPNAVGISMNTTFKGQTLSCKSYGTLAKSESGNDSTTSDKE